MSGGKKYAVKSTHIIQRNRNKGRYCSLKIQIDIKSLRYAMKRAVLATSQC